MKNKTDKLLDITIQLETFESYMNALNFKINLSKINVNDETIISLTEQVNNARDFKDCFLNSIRPIINNLHDIRNELEELQEN